MTKAKEIDERPFGEAFWKEEGGDKWVENIDLLENQLAPLDDILLNRCAVQEGEVILDIGCGGGVTCTALAAQTGASGRVLGVDISRPILEVAKQRYRDILNLEYRLADAGSEDLGRAGYDLVVSRFGVMFFRQPLEAFRNIRGFLKPDGRLVFLCWRTLEENPWMTVPAEAAFTVLPRPEPPAEPDPDAPGPFSLGDRDRLEALLEGAGYQGVRLEAVDIGMQLGSLEEAGHMATQIGPAAKPIQEVADGDRAAAIKHIEKALQAYDTPQGVVVPGACWVVTAGA